MIAWAFAAVACAPSARPQPPVAPAPPVASATLAPATAPSGAASASPTPPALRQPTDALPTAYAAFLDVDPAASVFSGRVVIDLDVRVPTDVIWLHAEALTVARATVGDVAATIVAAPERHMIGLHLPAPLARGATRAELVYTGEVVHEDSMGVFAQKTADDWYLYTQFEPLGARRAFPCFDEPTYKVPWQLTVTAPAGLVVASNTAIEEQHEAAGKQTLRFARTPALPSYLVAFTVGPYEIVDAGRAAGGAPVRVFTPRGQAREAAYAAEVTAPLLSRLEAYLGTPYPFAKLDLVPIPKTFTFSAMENPGLITYVEDLLLHKPEELSLLDRRSYASTAVHEMAHQWFGNLVTTSWWNDIWLNEAMASWLPPKILADWQPSWGQPVAEVRRSGSVMKVDAYDTIRRVREPVRDENDITNAFDGITYSKGSSVLRMMERYVGEAAFQKGIRAYLARRARGVATYEDFVADVSAGAGAELAGPLSSFFEQTGVPLVSFELSCPAGGAPRLALTQRRYLPLGSTGDATRTWQVPVCVRWSAGGKPGHACTLLGAARGELELAGAVGCPDWLLPNQDGYGYYRSQLSPELFARLLDKKVLAKLSAGERLAVGSDVSALVASGDAELGRALALAQALAGDPDRYVRQAAMGALVGVDEMVPEALRPRYQHALRALFGAAARKAGFAPRQGEAEDAAILRPQLLWLVGDLGDDPALQVEARRLAWKWFDDPHVLAPELVDGVLGLAAARGDAELYERALVALRAAKDLQDRQRLFGMLASFRDPALVARSLELVLGDEFPLTESYTLLGSASAHRETRALAWKTVTAHYDAIAARLPRENVAYLVKLGGRFCSDAQRAELAAFFAPRSARAIGGPRVFRNTVEGIALCVAYRAKQEGSLEAFLRKF
jgi:alanyl aminopeptidase